MKKSVIFVILIVCILSIFMVAFFGAKASTEQFKVYINELEITSYDGIDIDGDKYKKLIFDEVNGTSFFVEYKIGPKNATNPDKISFSLLNNTYIDYDGEEKKTAIIDQKGEIYFYTYGEVIVEIKSEDGLGVKDRLIIICLEPLS